MTIADELAQVNADLEHDDYPENGVTRTTIRRAVEALRAAERVADVWADEWDCSASPGHASVHEAVEALVAVLNERPSAAPRKPIVGCADCKWNGDYLMQQCAEHTRPSAAERSEDNGR